MPTACKGQLSSGLEWGFLHPRAGVPDPVNRPGYEGPPWQPADPRRAGGEGPVGARQQLERVDGPGRGRGQDRTKAPPRHRPESRSPGGRGRGRSPVRAGAARPGLDGGHLVASGGLTWRPWRARRRGGSSSGETRIPEELPLRPKMLLMFGSPPTFAGAGGSLTVASGNDRMLVGRAIAGCCWPLPQPLGFRILQPPEQRGEGIGRPGGHISDGTPRGADGFSRVARRSSCRWRPSTRSD
jgi:hypothetical protein